MSACGRFCCKSPFALVIKIYFGCTGDFRVKMWGTSSPDDKLTDDLGNAIEGTRISGRRWIFLTVEKLAPSDLGLLQQNRHQAGMRPLNGLREPAFAQEKRCLSLRMVILLPILLKPAMLPHEDNARYCLSTAARGPQDRSPVSEQRCGRWLSRACVALSRRKHASPVSGCATQASMGAVQIRNLPLGGGTVCATSSMTNHRIEGC